MKWAHLPNAGGLYDQDPILLDRFQIIFGAITEHEKREREEEERKREQEMSKAKSSRRARGRRR